MSYQRRKVIKALRARGVDVRREGGSHTIVQAPSGKRTSVGRGKELRRSTVRDIARQLGLDWQDFRKDLT